MSIPNNFQRNMIPRSNSTSDLFSFADAVHPYSHIGQIKSRRVRRHSSLTTDSSVYSNMMAERSSSLSLTEEKPSIEDSRRGFYKQRRVPIRPMTPHEMQRIKMQSAFQFPNGESFIPRKQSRQLQSETQEVMPNSRQADISLEQTPKRNNDLNVFSNSPASSKTSTDTENSMMSNNDSNETIPSLENDETTLPIPLKPLFLDSKRLTTFKTTEPKSSEKKIKHNVKSVGYTKQARSTSKQRTKTNTQSVPNHTVPNHNKSALVSFLKRIWDPFSKKDVQSSTKDAKRDNIKPQCKLKVPKPKQNVEKEESFSLLQTNIDVTDELMNADLIFDSILLKLSSTERSFKIPNTRYSKQKNDQQDDTLMETTDYITEDEKESDIIIDYDIINEFSKLGNLISVTPEENMQESPLVPPPRSSSRPTLESKEHASRFYNHLRLNEFAARLQEHWPVIHINEMPQKTSTDHKKEVRFSKEIYLCETWSSFEYERCSRKFKERMMFLMSGQNNFQFFEEVKMELNTFKKDEMIVHEDSALYTHFLI